MGPNGTIVMDIPLADMGSPPPVASINETFAATHGSLVAVYWTAAIDCAPDSSYGAPWIIGGSC